jgi:signal transduction histidine kinase
MALASGVDAELHDGLVLPREGSFAGAAMAAGEAVGSTDIAADPRITAGPPRWAGLGPAVAVPMRGADGARGALVVARSQGRPPFTQEQTVSLLAFADQAALAMELAQHRREAERVALYADRDRIARDLHDLAIQRLFAAGMTLQSTLRFVERPEGRERLLRVVDDLDDTIKTIRSTIFGLRSDTAGPAAHGLRVRTARAVEEAVPALGFTPSLRTEGLVDTDVPRAVADQVVAVLGEALSNTARHANATAADVTLVVRGGELALTVADDGVGIPAGGRRSGLANLAQRAADLGGTLDLGTPPGGGARLVWRVPLGH